MVTDFQEKACIKALREYRKKFLTKKENLNADESTARLMVNNFLNSVLGYTLIDEIKTEHMIRGTYVDYVIQLNKKIQFVIEAKATSIDLNDRHLKQAIDYAVNEGVDWAILTNGRYVELHRVIFEKPIRSQKIFSYDLSNLATIRTAAKHIVFLTKRAVIKGELETYWKRFDALTYDNMKKAVKSPEVIRSLRLQIKKKSGINFSDSEIIKSLDEIITK
ncbi:MAG: type I restriction enzyme HsdR N-terminal domain-containing protein [Candidatus Saccharibacteria bacterium]|nr:type I restriction enzyme HsdR N-terminal domain-containing protein [Candidatus Saccharibacteria bacterium]